MTTETKDSSKRALSRKGQDTAKQRDSIVSQFATDMHTEATRSHNRLPGVFGLAVKIRPVVI